VIANARINKHQQAPCSKKQQSQRSHSAVTFSHSPSTLEPGTFGTPAAPLRFSRFAKTQRKCSKTAAGTVGTPGTNPPQFSHSAITAQSHLVTAQSQLVAISANHGLESVATLARSVLRGELARCRRVLNRRELATLRTRSASRNPMWWRVRSFCISRRFQWLHFQPFTNFSGFLPEITPFCGLFSTTFSALRRSYSKTEWPTNAR
jgi:hypothetical protein